MAIMFGGKTWAIDPKFHNLFRITQKLTEEEFQFTSKTLSVYNKDMGLKYMANCSCLVLCRLS